jgi:hypothetical protein
MWFQVTHSMFRMRWTNNYTGEETASADLPLTSRIELKARFSSGRMTASRQFSLCRDPEALVGTSGTLSAQ